MAEKIFYPDFFNDVFGPIMQPGSSGGFAGTSRSARVARYSVLSEPKKVTFIFAPGSHTIDSLGTFMEDRAYLGGILDFDTEDERLFSAHEVARERGLSYEFKEGPEAERIPPYSAYVVIKGKDGETGTAVVSSIGGGMVRAYRLNDFEVSYQADTYGLLVWKESESVDDDIKEFLKNELGDSFVDVNIVKDSKDKSGAFAEADADIDEKLIKLLKDKGFEYRVYPALLPVVTTLKRKPQLFNTVTDWKRIAKERGISFVDAAIEYEKDFSGWSREQIIERFEKIADILYHQVHALEELGVNNVKDTPVLPVYGKHWDRYKKENDQLTDTLTQRIIENALSTNAKVPGVKIVPGPMGTGGGYLFSAVDAVREAKGYSHEKVIEALIVAAAFGAIAYTRSNPSGERGCVGESGVCNAMASAAVAQLSGATPDQVENAASMALQANLGLVCDVIPGGKEFPCITRTVRAAVTAPLYADLARAGIDPIIPYHEVIDAMEEHYKKTPQEMLCGFTCGINSSPAAHKCHLFQQTEYMNGKLKYEAPKE
ncbi:MAG: L-serine ammonia-lyase, iron-sulfur-dependent, subunit alpha [Eubacterium sp.]|nr:L-serine ammonia-lyase, iron-sulfur-dependent, subunit alpha [Eubacterium sp.]